MSQANLHSILYVEDDLDIFELVKIALGSLGGFELCACNSGAQALQMAGEVCVDLLLLDVMMPDMDGPSTLLNLRQLPEYAETPVIFMTAKLQTEDLLRYRNLGALGVLAKPFDPMSLAEQVRKLWDSQFA